jgi:hypothetical protein
MDTLSCKEMLQGQTYGRVSNIPVIQSLQRWKLVLVKEYSSPTQGGARFALQVEFRTSERIGLRTMTLVAGSLQYL